MKVAIAHDFLNVFGGAERVTLELSRIYPEAPIFTLFYNKKNLGEIFGEKKIITSSLQKKAEFLGFHHKYLLPFMPRAVEEFDFRDFDVVISSQSAWMKGIITKPETVHVSYCHTPTRFLWIAPEEYLNQQNPGFVKRFFAKRIIDKIRIWDKLAADRVDYFVTNSNFTKERIAKYYRRDAKIIYPSVDTEKFLPGAKKEDSFLIISRLSGYKGIDIAIEAFNKLGLPLVVIGEGQERKKLESIAGKNIKFLGFVEDKEMIKYLQSARAFIFPIFEEDFGLTPAESMSCGVPVIAARSGGAKETVIENKTGVFFREPKAESLTSAVKEFIAKEKSFDSKKIQNYAQKFSSNNFKRNIKEFVELSFKKGI